MAFTEFYVTKHGSALDTNGGSGEAGAITVADVDAVHDGAGVHTLTDQGADGFAGTNVDDFICWDTAGSKEFARVTEVTSDDVIVVLNMVGAQAFTGLEEKAVSVGGAWAKVQAGVTAMTVSFVNAAGDTPWLNVAAGTYAEDIDQINAGTQAIPLGYGGYTTNPRDGGLVTINAAGLANHAAAWDCNQKNHLIVQDFYLIADQASIDGLFAASSNYCTFRRIKAKATGLSAVGIDVTNTVGTQVLECWVEQAAGIGIVGG
ncbi:MAG TPA: hypothetical protein VMY42_08775, partial [Thermoguttaceae bacterium]|nr:hypothetical protein [Thermoguttaceae bacterium]